MKLRKTNIERLKNESFDVLIIGGGINGAVSAASLSGKGAKVALIDRVDFAGFTSMQSSNLAWGGIKYLETYEFGLVRKLCMSRNHLMRSYPSTVQEIRFFTTLAKGFRYPPWFLFCGTLFYWLMGNFFTKPPRYLTPSIINKEEPVVNTDNSNGGMEYSDAYLHDNDARFVFNFIRGALNYGCAAANYVESLGASQNQGLWKTKVRDTVSGEEFTITSKALINCCGPFVDEHNQITGQKTEHHHAFSKGIHLIVDRITPNKRVLTFFADDGRLFFVIPMGPKTSIGTTDTKVQSPNTEVTAEDRKFVLDNINKRLKLDKPITESDVIAERCGVRPLVVSGNTSGNQDWFQLSRKHVVEANVKDRHISIFGGKLTDCLNVGEEVFHEVRKFGVEFPFPDKKWYGEPPDAVKEEFFHQARLMNLDAMTPATSSEKLTFRLWRRYGAHALGMLESIRREPEMAELLIENSEYLRCEVEEAAQREMITKLDDFLRRRSKITQVVPHDVVRDSAGLKDACVIFFGDQAEERYQEYFREHQ
ncbi:MAG: FAD-dependent oxidoreductase [SAR324 cluster bacterium]|nr:FAD-dependent oxidoreductase [SAR324 cluster bacterium]